MEILELVMVDMLFVHMVEVFVHMVDKGAGDGASVGGGDNGGDEDGGGEDDGGSGDKGGGNGEGTCNGWPHLKPVVIDKYGIKILVEKLLRKFTFKFIKSDV
ncbi:hypothetical protein Tco_0360829 [Tanacetum coccineum]